MDTFSETLELCFNLCSSEVVVSGRFVHFKQNRGCNIQVILLDVKNDSGQMWPFSLKL